MHGWRKPCGTAGTPCRRTRRTCTSCWPMKWMSPAPRERTSWWPGGTVWGGSTWWSRRGRRYAFQRTFEPGETGSVRLLLAEARIPFACTARARRDLARDRARTGCRHRDRGRAPGAIACTSAIARAPGKGRLDRLPAGAARLGSSSGVSPRVGYDADLGLILGAQAARTDYAFRRTPYGSRVRLTTEYATAADGLRTELLADVRRVNPRLRLELRARASEIEVVRFAGHGNETPVPEGRASTTSISGSSYWRPPWRTPAPRDCSCTAVRS